VRIKVQGGTASSSEPSLCLTCRHATVVRGDRESEIHIGCNEISFGRRGADTVPFSKVTQCGIYSNKAEVSLGEMKDTAWILVTDRARTTIGFKPAREWNKENKHEEIVPWHAIED
jgi:hypothetical protein